ncbi:DUF934 domain-containing protein [Cupriavidus lacunae]|uniref:Oxidoreductase n=1 Tax=Cupriavidus lacunae TaxID=2666307 RepID=A0A370NWL1_9BURK|nr:DUF934 domain-containing protein [Cupriavidus lacunae]RDK09973.1 hypothetical protein DN412_12740 [Cupriavidus lacunae]
MPDHDHSAGQDRRTVIRDGQLIADNWLAHIGDAQDADNACPPDEPGYLVTLENWTANRKRYRLRQHSLAVYLSPDAEPQTLLEPGATVVDPTGIAMIAIDFPIYTDGRGYSIAQLLRHQLGWTGELRAVGDVMIDTVHYLARCGFNSFAIKPGHDPAAAMRALATFSSSYQRSYGPASR